MKKALIRFPILMFLLCNLSGCHISRSNDISLSAIYGLTALLSLLLLIGYYCLIPKKNKWFILLFSSVLVVNTGYTLLSTSSCLSIALWANRVSYLGSVFLPLSMLMIILNITNTIYKKWLPKFLFILAAIFFLLAASPGILPLYYKEVSFTVIDGVSTLEKVYGPLHPLYLFYLLGYFTSMIIVIIRAKIKKSIDTTAHAIFLAIAVFVNIGVWFIEQLTSIDFEMLSISYIISELFLLSFHLMMQEYHKMHNIIQQVESTNIDYITEIPLDTNVFSKEKLDFFILGIKQLTPTEHSIYDAYIARLTTKEIMAKFNIKESTLKYHNRNIYSKLGVTSRKEFLEIYKHIKSIKENINDTH